MSMEKEDEKQQDPENAESTIASNNNEAVDFTADISLDQLDDRDVMDHLNEIENIVLDAESFGLQVDSDKPSTKQQESTNSKNDEDQDIILLEESEGLDLTILSASSPKTNIDNQEEKSCDVINEEKLKAKVEIVNNKFTKLARVLNKSFPSYKNWLERVTALSGASICRLEIPRSCPADRQPTNRWKFTCTRKPLEESAESNTEGIIADVNVDNENIKTIWRLGPSEGTVENTNNVLQSYPDFVMRAAKIFEDFINGIEPMETTDEAKSKEDTGKTELTDLKEVIKVENEEELPKENPNKQEWSWLLIRGNNKKELMVYVTGKEISPGSMNNLKKLFETGAGKDCLVKSLYCKSIAMVNNATICTTTFLLGSEALDETVGELKIQLPPKTNFPASTVGMELLGKAVEDLLSPNIKISVVEIGCGLGVIGLMMSPRCHKVIGVDSQAEIEEAEMTTDLNKIKNASFMTGPPNELIKKLTIAFKGCKTSAIVNANTKLGRDIEVLSGLRTIQSIRRVAVITSMSKQSIRPIFELMKPADEFLGNPFMPIRAVVVDTQPTSSYFEVVMLMERRTMNKILRPFVPISPTKSIESCSSQLSVQAITKPRVRSNISSSVKVTAIPSVARAKKKTGVPVIMNKKIIPTKKVPPVIGIDENPVVKKFVKNPFHQKLDNQAKQTVSKVRFRPGKSNHEILPVRKRPDDRSIPPKMSLKRKHKDWDGRGPVVPEKYSRNHEVRSNSRSKPSIDRNESTTIIETMKQHQKVLEEVIQELSGPKVDPLVAKHKMIKQMNQIKSQLSRSVWDRIAPPENPDSGNSNQDDSFNFGHDIGAEDLVITTPNHEYLKSCATQRVYEDIPPLEPNQVMPNDRYDVIGYKNLRYDNGRVPYENDKWNRNKTYEKDHWKAGSSRSSGHYDRISPKRSHLSRPLSPPRRHSPSNRSRDDDIRRHMSPPRRHLSRDPISPSRHLNQEPQRNYGRIPPRRPMIPIVRQSISPSRRPMSPPRRTMTPVQIDDDWDIPSRGAVEQESGWQRQDRQPEITWDINQQIDNFRKPNNVESSNWEMNNMQNDDNWNIQQTIQKKTMNKEPNWQANVVVENRWNSSGLGNDNWSMRNKETFNKPNNSRDNSWSDNNKPRWEQPNFQKNWNSVNDNDDWNDLPEDARDPWGDDGGPVNKERWQNLEQGNWTRDKNDSMEWPGPNNGPPMNSMWQNQNPNVNNQRWGGNFNDNGPKKIPQGINWQQQQQQGPPMNNSWRPGFPGGFQQQQQQRSFNNFNDGR